MNNTITPCEYARERHMNLAKWRNLWSILLLAFGTAVVLFLILAIFLFIRQNWLPGAVSTLGTMANGLAMSWVKARRSDAVAEEQSAYDEVVRRCGGGPGNGANGPPQGGPPPAIVGELQALVGKQRLIGNFR